MNDRDGGLTIISRCGQEPTIRLVSERVASLGMDFAAPKGATQGEGAPARASALVAPN